MEQRKIARLLVAAGVLAALIGCGIMFVFVPLGAAEFRQEYPALAHFYWPGLILSWALAGLYAAAMADYFRICVRIGNDRSFCRENAGALGRISWLLWIAAGLFLAVLLVCFLHSIGPFAFSLLLLACAVANGAMGVLAWGIGKLLSRAVAIKEENDLTV